MVNKTIQPIENTVVFYDNSKKYHVHLILSKDINQFLLENQSKKDLDLCERFKSNIYRLMNGRVLEMRDGWICGKLYEDEKDIIPLRSASLTYINPGRIIITTNYTGASVQFLIDYYKSKPILGLVEDTRIACQMNNGKILVLHGRNGNYTNATIYETMDDLNVLDPFNWDIREDEIDNSRH